MQKSRGRRLHFKVTEARVPVPTPDRALAPQHLAMSGQ